MLGALGVATLVLVNLLALVMIPLGLPGTFVQVGAAAVAALATGGHLVGWRWVVLFLVLALVGEVVEFVSGRWGARRFGGSSSAAWGALVGGVVGAIVGGIPIPVVGAVVASFVGTFAGALLGEMIAQRRVTPDLRVGVGAVLGRTAGTAVKLFVSLAILILT